MTLNIVHKNSVANTGGSADAPTASDLEFGEVAVNYAAADPALFVKDSSNNVVRLNEGPETVTTSKIAGSAVTTGKIASNAVTNAKLANDSVRTAEIQDDAVTTSKIADANITTAKIADANVNTAKIADDAITLVKLDNDISNKLGYRNLLMNGDMRISQRGTSATSPVNGGHLLDRWIHYNTDTNITVERNTTTGLAGFATSQKWTRTTGSALSNSGYLIISQKIEGVNSCQLEYGTANAKTITISFWAKSNVTGNYALTVRNNVATETATSYSTLFSLSTTDWTYITLTIPGPISGSWLGVSSEVGLEVLWNLDVGTDRHPASADTWITLDSKFGLSTAANNWADTTGNTFEITGVQLEMGSTATPFEYTDWASELAKCQRYYYRNENYIYCGRYASNNGMAKVNMPVTMRDTPNSFVYTVSGMTGSFIANYINRHVCNAYHSDISYALNDIQIDAEF